MTTSEKIDLYKIHKTDYAAPKKPVWVDIAKASYLTVSGSGAPGGGDFQARIGALYGMAFTIKMTRKFEGRGDYTVCKLEAQWWHGDGSPDFQNAPPDQWRWKLLIRTPEFVGASALSSAAGKLRSKGKGDRVEDVTLESLAEGKCVQMLHVGPYEREGETVEIMHRFAEGQGYTFGGLHHEVYLSDPRRVPPERLKTVLRRPVRKV
jgi:hypothetical protein